MAWTDPRTWSTGEVVTAAMLNTDLRDNLDAMGDAWTPYTPTWRNGGTTTLSIGSGSLAGKYRRTGKTWWFNISLTRAADSNTGTTYWTWDLPAIPNGRWSGSGYYTDASTFANVPLTWITVAGTNQILCVTSSGARVTNSAPITWATSDRIDLCGVFEAA